MLSPRSALVAATALLAVPAWAAPATPEGAARLESVFRSYLGTLDGVVLVEPEGEDYLVTLDASPFLALSKAQGVTGAFAPMHLTLTDLGDGKWAVAQDEPMAITLDVPGVLAIDVRVDQSTFQGTYDEALKAFAESSGSATGIAVHEVIQAPDGPANEVNYEVERFEVTSTATSGLAGTIDGKVTYLGAGITQRASLPPGPDGAPLGEMVLSADTYNSDATVEGLHSDAMLRLLAWAVAHPSEAAVRADFEALKAEVRTALPLWNRIHGTTRVEAITVTTPFGNGAADSAEVMIDATGVVREARFRERLTLSGLVLPTELMPDWVPALLPKDVSIDVEVEGFDLATPAGMLLDEITPDTEPPADFEDRLGVALLPKGMVTVRLAPQGLSSPGYAFAVEGGFDTGPGRMPVGSGRITLSGIEAILTALGAAPAEVKQGVVPAIMIARGMAKPDGQGGFAWEVEATEDGKVLINGADVSGLAGGGQ